MAKTLYRVYMCQDNGQYVAEDGPPDLIYLGEEEASSGRQAVAAVVREPREATEYAAIPVRNITTYAPKFKPATVSWS